MTMKTEIAQPAPRVGTNDLLGFLREKLAAAESSLRAREQAEECWSGGTSKSWREVGCKLSKKERLNRAAAEKRIGEKCRNEVEMLRQVIAALGQFDRERRMMAKLASDEAEFFNPAEAWEATRLRNELLDKPNDKPSNAGPPGVS